MSQVVLFAGRLLSRCGTAGACGCGSGATGFGRGCGSEFGRTAPLGCFGCFTGFGRWILPRFLAMSHPMLPIVVENERNRRRWQVRIDRGILLGLPEEGCNPLGTRLLHVFGDRGITGRVG